MGKKVVIFLVDKVSQNGIAGSFGVERVIGFEGKRGRTPSTVNLWIFASEKNSRTRAIVDI